MAEIDDALPNTPVSDEAFVEQEVAIPGQDLPKDPQKPEVIMDEMGGAEISFDPRKENLSSDTHFQNLAEVMDDQDLDELGSTLFDKYTEYKESRGDWEQSYREGLELLGFKYERRTEPFRGASGVNHPVLAEAVTQFQAQAYKELVPSDGPVRTQVVGLQTPAIEEQADRVKDYMNYMLMEEMEEYTTDMDSMLFHLPLSGSSFKKVYYDEIVKRPVSKFIPAEDLVVPYYASDLKDTDRITHVQRLTENEVVKLMAGGFYRDIDLPKAGENATDNVQKKINELEGVKKTGDDFLHTILEMHVDLHLDDYEKFDSRAKKIKIPYVVTIDEGSGEVLSIYRNYKQDDKNKEKISHFVHYRFVPGFGFYGLGLIHFLGNLTMSATAAMRSLIDAGQFANLPGGFKAKGLRVVGDNEPISPGEFKEVEATGVDLSKAIVPLPYKEPSSTLFQMLGFVTAAGQKFADSTEQIVSDAASYGPVGTTMALLEASSKFFSAIHKRLHKSQREEFKILARIDSEYLPMEYPYEVPYAEQSVFKKDFDGRVDVIPVSDPNIPSNAHRMMLAQMALQMAQQSPPGMFNIEALNRTILNAANMPNIEEILPQAPKPQPLDPVSDIAAATKGFPIAAFMGQNHDAHIQVKMAYLQDPANGASPIMVRLKPILEANIQEHSIMKYQEQINGTTQAMLEQIPEAQRNPTAIEAVMAAAAQDLLNANKQGPAMSPEQQLVALEQAKVELEKEKLKLDAAKENAKISIEAQELDIKRQAQMLDAQHKGISTSLKSQKAVDDRTSREALKQLDIMTKLSIEEEKLQLEQQKLLFDSAKKQVDVEQKEDKEALKFLKDINK